MPNRFGASRKGRDDPAIRLLTFVQFQIWRETPVARAKPELNLSIALTDYGWALDSSAERLGLFVTQRQAVAIVRAEGMPTSMFEYVLIEYLWRKGEMAEGVNVYRNSLSERRGGAEVPDGDVADSLYASAQELLGQREYELAEPLLRLCRVVQEGAAPTGTVTPGDK